MNSSIFQILQLAGGTFPTGGFSQSWGLETYVSEGKIKDVDGFEEFLKMYLDMVIGRCEGPALCRAYDLTRDWDAKGLEDLEELVSAMKLTKESRESGHRTGKALMRIAVEMLKDEKLSDFYRKNSKKGIHYSTAFGIVCNKMEIEKKDSLEAFVFSSINGLIQSGIKLVPLGNVEAQVLMMKVQPYMKDAVDLSINTQLEAVSNFSPGLDIASMRHENLTTRLYMS